MNNKKNFIKILAIAICVGFLGGFLKLLYEKNFGPLPIVGYVGIAIAVFIVIFLLTTIPSLKLKKKIVALNNILYNEHNAKKYLEGMEKLQNRRKSMFDVQYDKNKVVIDINVAIGYMATNRYDKAVKLMRSVDVTGIHHFTKAIFYANYIYSLFRIKKVKEALTLLDNHRDLILQFQDVLNIGAYINMDLAQESKEYKNEEDMIYYLDKAKNLAQGFYESQEYEKISRILRGQ